MRLNRFPLAVSVALVVVASSVVGVLALGGTSDPADPAAASGGTSTPTRSSTSFVPPITSPTTSPTTAADEPETLVEVPPDPVAPVHPPEPVAPDGSPRPTSPTGSSGPSLPTAGEPAPGRHGRNATPLGELATGAVAHPDLPLGISPQVPGPTGPGSGPGGYSVGTGCASQCITRGVALPRGTGARLEVDTDTPARIWILVWQEGGSQTLQFESGHSPLVTSFAADLDDLEPGTTYMAMAVAEDAAGYADHASGSFTTLQERTLRIDFDTPDIQSWPAGDVIDSYVRIGVDGDWQPDDAWTNGLAPMVGVDRTLDLEARVVVVTENGGGLDQAFDVRQLTQPTGSIDGNTWAFTVLEDIDLDDHPGTDTWWDEHTLHRTLVMPEWGGSLPADYGASLALSIPVTLLVSYE